MYYPYFRGKQFELLAIREAAALMARSEITPIIEPVTSKLNALEKALDVIREEDGSVIVIINPQVGDLVGSIGTITAMLDARYAGAPRITAGILLTNRMSAVDAIKLHAENEAHFPVFIHAGFMDAQALATELGQDLSNSRHVFCGKTSAAHMQHFAAAHRVLLADGFVKRKNAAHPPLERFSDIHLTFRKLGMNGFGDFLMVGEDFQEGGGPAYAIAIHLTFIDPEQHDEMMIYHFISNRVETPDDPGGKFAEALAKLETKYQSGASNLYAGQAMAEFMRLHAIGHFPGLGMVKKLSMIHHIETYADYL